MSKSASSASVTSISNPVSSTSRCEHKTARGKRCTSVCGHGHPSLCTHHAQQEARNAQRAAASAAAVAARASNHQPPMRNFASEILGPVTEFQTAASINHVLGRLLVLLAANRIPSRSAGTIAYVCQLMLQSLPEVKEECTDVLDNDEMEEALYEMISTLPDLRPSLGASKCK